MTQLRVDLYGRQIGTIEGARASFDFEADPEAVRVHGVGSTILSFAVPLTPTPRPSDRAVRANFFEEVLAEGPARKRLGGNARIDEDNTIALLSRYGRDVAGALQIWDPTNPAEPRMPATTPASATRIRQMLVEVKRSPIGNASVRHMSSLAGMQDKIVLARADGGWAEALDGFPSTHIIKPVAGDYPSSHRKPGHACEEHLCAASAGRHSRTGADVRRRSPDAPAR